MLLCANPVKLQCGALLPTTLIFLMLLLSLGITMTTLACLELRMITGTKRNLEEFHAAELGLKIGESQLLLDKMPVCYSAAMNDKPWLTNNSCLFNLDQIEVNYFVEKIENNTSLCIQVNGSSVGLAAEIYRLTVWVKRQQNDTVILQSIYAKTASNVCKEGGLNVRGGRLSWREVS